MCFLFMYFLLPHWVPATWRSRAQTSMRAELPSGKIPTTRVLRRISRFSLSIFMPHSICATYCTLSTIKNRHLRNQSKMAFFCFVSEHHLDGKAAAEEVGVRPIPIWWRRGESNPCPKALQQDFLRAQLRFEHSLLDAARNRRGDSVES